MFHIIDGAERHVNDYSRVIITIVTTTQRLFDYTYIFGFLELPGVPKKSLGHQKFILKNRIGLHRS